MGKVEKKLKPYDHAENSILNNEAHSQSIEIFSHPKVFQNSVAGTQWILHEQL